MFLESSYQNDFMEWCDTEDWSNDWWNYIWTYIKTENTYYNL